MLDEWAQKVRAGIRAVERPQRPVSDYAEALRRDGRWLFLIESRRSKVNELASGYHQNQPKQHARQKDSDAVCDDCVRLVRRQLARARQLLTLADPR